MEKRARGGIRPGLTKYLNAQLDGTNRIQDVTYTVTIADTAPNTSGLSVRTVTPVAVSNGTIATFNSTSFTNATVSGSRTLSNTAPFVLSTELFGRLYYTDGISYKVFVASNTTAIDWTTTAGSLPGTDGTKVARLIEMWRSRIMLAGLRTDPHNFFASKLGDANNWDTAPSETTEIQAFAGGVGVVGKMPDVINCMIPWNDDILIVGCDHSIYVLNGDPQAGGRIDMITNNIGMAFGRPWCIDSTGRVYFFSNRGHVYTLAGPGQLPESLTKDTIDPEIEAIDLNANFIRMAFDERQYGFYLFITPFSTGATTHYFYDLRVRGWFKVVFAENNHNPMALTVFDGDSANDRVILLGGEDGRIRKIDSTSASDDSGKIEATVTLGPIKNDDGRPFVISQLQAIMDNDSSDIDYQVRSSDSPEHCLELFPASFTSANKDGTFSAGTTGKSTASNPRSGGYYSYLRIGTNTNSSQFAIESIRAKIATIVSEEGRKIARD